MDSFFNAKCPKCGLECWSVYENKRIKCSYCGHEYYLNKKKPETGANSQSAFPKQK